MFGFVLCSDGRRWDLGSGLSLLFCAASSSAVWFVSALVEN